MPPAAPMPDIRSRAPPAAGTRGQSATLSSSSHQTAGSTGTHGAAITRLEAIGIKSCCRSSQLAARLTAGHMLPHSRVQQSIAPLRTCLGDGEAQLGGQLPQQQVVGQALAHLHDAHDGGVDLVEAVLQHLLVGLLAVLVAVPAGGGKGAGQGGRAGAQCREGQGRSAAGGEQCESALLQAQQQAGAHTGLASTLVPHSLHLEVVDFDAVQAGGVLRVEAEHVAGGDLRHSRLLEQHPADSRGWGRGRQQDGEDGCGGRAALTHGQLIPAGAVACWHDGRSMLAADAAKKG